MENDFDIRTLREAVAKGRIRGAKEESYEFQGIDKLFDDFRNDVRRARK